MEKSEFINGYWTWEENRNVLNYVKIEKEKDLPRINASPTAHPTELVTPFYAAIRFKDVVGKVSQAQFKRLYRRKVKPNAPDVVTIQDVKDVVLFMAEVSDLSIEFINFFHLPTIDFFLRAGIIYFQYYFQVWEHVMDRREEAKQKLTQPIVRQKEDEIMNNLQDLRSILSREYLRLTCGLGDALVCYHLNNKNNVSTSEKDRRLFEAFMAASVRVIWCALQRKNFALIENELNRLLRTNIFNLIRHRKNRVDQFDTAPSEDRYLMGSSYQAEKKLKHRSPAAQEHIFGECDYKLLSIGVCDINSNEPRYRYLELAYRAPEELLHKLGIGVGLLGYPRNKLDSMLKPKERTKTDVLEDLVKIPDFVLPPRDLNSSETIASHSLPKTPCKVEGTSEYRKSRIKQKKLWIRHVETQGNIVHFLKSASEHPSRSLMALSGVYSLQFDVSKGTI